MDSGVHCHFQVGASRIAVSVRGAVHVTRSESLPEIPQPSSLTPPNLAYNTWPGGKKHGWKFLPAPLPTVVPHHPAGRLVPTTARAFGRQRSNQLSHRICLVRRDHESRTCTWGLVDDRLRPSRRVVTRGRQNRTSSLADMKKPTAPNRDRGLRFFTARRLRRSSRHATLPRLRSTAKERATKRPRLRRWPRYATPPLPAAMLRRLPCRLVCGYLPPA